MRAAIINQFGGPEVIEIADIEKPEPKGNLTQSLTEVFTTIGETAYRSEAPICFFIDEIQYMKSTELGALIVALHRAN